MAAYWLAKAGHDVTVIERAPVLRKEGQTVDIRKEGLRIIEWMRIREKVDERCTKEAGIRLVDEQERVWAAFPQSGDEGFTSEVEIVRGELSMLLYEISKSQVKYRFGTTIQEFTETENGVNVTLKGPNGQSHETFDVIIAAEGLYSRTRARAFNEDITKPIHSFHLFSASFSVPANENDTLWANGTVYRGRRMTLCRPDDFGRIRIGLSWYDDGPETRAIAHPNTPKERQKEFVRSRFADLVSESPTLVRFLDGLAKSEDLYLAEIGQTKMPSWSRGRVVLLGDTAYCPSAMTGMGTTAAIAGAYVLAAELVCHPTEHSKAFAEYEAQVRPWIEKIQVIPSARVGLGRPASQFGVNILYWVMYTVSLVVKIGFVSSFLSRFAPSTKQTLPLPPASTFDRSDL